MLERLQGAKLAMPATPVVTFPCFILVKNIARRTARNLLLKTQNVADGKRPSGFRGVGVNFVVMMSCESTEIEWFSLVVAD